MSKYYGNVGFEKTEETSPGVWTPTIVEHPCYGEVTRFVGNNQPSSSVNDDVVINNTISILADPFAYTNLSAMRYICWMDVKWKIKSIEVQYPRLILTIGGVYNGD